MLKNHARDPPKKCGKRLSQHLVINLASKHHRLFVHVFALCKKRKAPEKLFLTGCGKARFSFVHNPCAKPYVLFLVTIFALTQIHTNINVQDTFPKLTDHHFFLVSRNTFEFSQNEMKIKWHSGFSKV